MPRNPLNVVKAEWGRLEAARECGPCTACCVLPRVQPELGSPLPDGKPGYTKCQHLTAGGFTTAGCGCYALRPEVCRGFTCAWRGGILAGDERRRPDRLGIMVTTEEFRSKHVIEAWELWPFALRDHPGRGLLESLTQQYIVVCRFYGVPASIQYRGPETLAIGEVLSAWAREDPRRLADWLERQVVTGHLENPDTHEVAKEVEALRRGECVEEHFRRDGQCP